MQFKPHAPRFLGNVALLFVLLGTLQLIGGLLFYQAMDRQTVRQDHARRIAELLVVSDRIFALVPRQTTRVVSTRYLTATLSRNPEVHDDTGSSALADIEREIVSWEPSLSGRDLRLEIRRQGSGSRDLSGSIQIASGWWLNFRSAGIEAMWPIATRTITMALVGSAASIIIGLLMLQIIGRPLRRLTNAAEAIGHGRSLEVREEGPRDLRDLAHAMNQMQARIERLLRDQAKSFQAISHDLRTPLSRQKIVADLVGGRELASILLSSVREMDDLLTSLQHFLRAQHLTASVEHVDLLELAQNVAKPFGSRVTVQANAKLVASTFREPLELALAALVENAVHFGERAELTLSKVGAGSHEIAVIDQGPGIDPRYFEDILDPFFRLDEARARNTVGFGLGIPTAHTLMMRFGGKLSFSAAANGGLVATLTIPSAI